jgi:hypothetical protein
MNTQEWIDDIEDELRTAGIKVNWERWDLLNWASAELNKLSQEFTADCLMVYLDPIVVTASGTRQYDLPANFGTNFAEAAGDQGEGFCCMLNDGSSDSRLEYVTATRLFSRDLTSSSSSRPGTYTIISSANGRKQIWLDPVPNAAYDIKGLYKPTDWDLKTMDDIPSLPANSPIIKYSVLRRLDPNRWNADYVLARNNLLMEFARGRIVKFMPNNGGYRNSATLM